MGIKEVFGIFRHAVNVDNTHSKRRRVFVISIPVYKRFHLDCASEIEKRNKNQAAISCGRCSDEENQRTSEASASQERGTARRMERQPVRQ